VVGRLALGLLPFVPRVPLDTTHLRLQMELDLDELRLVR
jgi:hypothetical protein